MKPIDASTGNRPPERAAVPTAPTAPTLLTGITPAITGKRGLANNGTYLQCPISCCDVYQRK